MRFSALMQFYKYSQWTAVIVLLIGVVFDLSITKAYEFDLVAKQLDVVDGQELGFFRGVALDDQGSVAYTAVAIDHETLELTGSALIVDNRRVVSTGDTIASGLLGFIGKPALAGDGSLTYSADVFMQGTGLSNTGAVVGNRSTPENHQLLVGRETTVGGVQLIGAINPAINNSGSLAYTGIYFDTLLDIDATAIILDGTVVAATADTVGNFVVDTVDHATLNDRRDLAFAATLINLTTTESSTAIFINGQLTAFDGAITDGLLLTEVFAPSLNQPGDLAYIGRYFDQAASLENTAIILNGQAVIKSGDLTNSGLIIDLIEDVTLNSSGQLAFQATFIDPATGAFFEEGIFLTRVIPEPSSLLLAAISLIVLLSSRRTSDAA